MLLKKMTDKLHWQCIIGDCERPKVGGLDVCMTHKQHEKKEQAEASKPVKEFKPLKRSPVKKVSDKRKDQNDEYSKLRDQFLKDNPICGACGTEPATDVHHKKGREGALLLEVQYFFPVCRVCHIFITEDSAWAIKEGYSLPRNGKV